jgi:hypothetical protein
VADAWYGIHPWNYGYPFKGYVMPGLERPAAAWLLPETDLVRLRSAARDVVILRELVARRIRELSP